jgi:hypothetical protein
MQMSVWPAMTAAPMRFSVSSSVRPAATRRRGNRMKRRQFIAGLGAAAWPLAARAQQGERVRRIGVLVSFDENDPVAKARISAFTQALAGFGWTEGRNVRMDLRWSALDIDQMHALAQELVGLQPDAANTLLLHESLNPILDQEGTSDAYRLDCEILPMVLEMQLRGMRIDSVAAERNRDLLYSKRDALLAELSEKLEVRVGMDELHKDAWLASTFDRIGVKYPRTPKGNPSFKGGNKGWMTGHAHWLPKLVARIERYHNAGYLFLQSHILDHVVNGRIHASIHPHRTGGDRQDDHGAKSFRFSYSDPPLQQMPSRDPEITPLIRRVFLPEEKQRWAKLDASQPAGELCQPAQPDWRRCGPRRVHQ